MKSVVASLLFAVVPMTAQSLIVKKDGSRVEAESVHIEAGNKKISYKLKDDSKTYKIKFKEVKEATWGDFIFQTLTLDSKEDGYYLMGQEQGKKLLVRKRIRIKSRGGFESNYVHHEVFVTDAQNRVIEALSFTDENNEKKAAARAKVIPMVQQHFASCKDLVQKFALFEGGDKILVLLNEPTFTACKS